MVRKEANCTTVSEEWPKSSQETGSELNGGKGILDSGRTLTDGGNAGDGGEGLHVVQHGRADGKGRKHHSPHSIDGRLVEGRTQGSDHRCMCQTNSGWRL